MKRKYNNPAIEIIKFTTSPVLSASSDDIYISAGAVKPLLAARMYSTAASTAMTGRRFGMTDKKQFEFLKNIFLLKAVHMKI